jgi:hypothetical protein
MPSVVSALFNSIKKSLLSEVLILLEFQKENFGDCGK